MKEDSVLKKLHKVREDILKEFNYDMKVLFEYTKKREKEQRRKGRKVVSFEKKKVKETVK
jgi:hypothetical protein